MSNPTPVVVIGDDLAAFLARTNQFGESNQDLVQQKFNKKQADGSSSPVFAALESRSRAVAQWGNLVDDFLLAYFSAGNGARLVFSGTGSPEGVVTASVGSLYLDTGIVASAGPVVYSKDSGAGDTGWIAMATETAGASFGRGPLGVHTVVGTETLTEDRSYESLTIPNGTVLETAGFRVWARDFIQIDTTGIVRNNGGNATDFTTPGGLPAAGGSLGPGTVGGIGGPLGGPGLQAGVPVADTSGGASGGAGGAGESGAGGASQTVDSAKPFHGGIDTGHPHLGAVVGFGVAGPGAIIVLSGGTGGGGGGGAAARVGGGGGGGAGLVLLSTRNLINNGTIEALGGNGAAGVASGNTGGGAGGGGGLILTVARYRSGSGTRSAAGGTGGAPGGSGTVGAVGFGGSTLEFTG